MKDYVGQTLAVGDRVVHARSGRYGGFQGAFYVHSFTAQMVRISKKDAPVSHTTVNPENLVKVPFKEDIK